MTKTEQTEFLDECAMRAMQASFNSYLSCPQQVAKGAYKMAEAMWTEKLEREKGDE